MDSLFDEISKSIGYKDFYSIIEKIPSNIFFKDTELRYRFSTHHWQQVNDENIIGKTDLEIRKDTENALIAMESDRNIIRTGVGCKYVIKSEIDGKVSYLELIKEPMFSEDGTVIGIVGLINDVTEKTLLSQKVEAANEELRSMLDKIQRLSESRKLFTASMNHELRTPLNVIIGLLQIVLSEGGLSQTQQEYISNAYKSSMTMLELVNELLDIAKMETDEFKIRQERFNLDDLIYNVKKSTEALAVSKGLEFRLAVTDNARESFYGDELRINQVINNLVSNAIKYTDNGSVELTIDYMNGELIINCADTGQGISEEAQKVLFDPYVRINESKNRMIQGTGLGLSIVKKIVDKMNGHIQVQSELDKGTTFMVSIPLERAQWADELFVEEDYISEQHSVDLSTLRVLCVDDMKVNVTVFEGLLKSTGMKVDKAYSGPEAINMSEMNKYDIIFMDHQMPNMDGVEALKLIREKCDINKNTPVIVLTGNVGEEYEKLYDEAGFDGYLTKPIIKEGLLATIHSLMRA